MAKKIGGIRITITGPQGCGKSRFVEEVLRSALLKSGCSFNLTDGDESIGYAEDGAPVVDVLVTNDAEIADAHTRGIRS